MLAGSQFVGSIGVPRASPDPHRWRRPGMAKWSREQKTDVFMSFVDGLSIGTVTWHGFVSKANHDKCCMFLRLQRCRCQQLESRAGGLRKSTRIGFGNPVLGLHVVGNVRDQAADRKPQKVPQDWGILLSAGWITLLPAIQVESDSWRDPYITSMAIGEGGRLLWIAQIHVQTILGGLFNVYTRTWG